MAKYRIHLTREAYVEQFIVVEASSPQEACDIIYKDESWDNNTWKIDGYASALPEVESVTEL